MAKNNAKLIDLSTLVQAGIDPKTGLPLKYSKNKDDLYPNMRKLFRVKDETEAVNRYVWENTHLSLTSSEVERFEYYNFSLAFFRLEGVFYLMPYALEGGLDFYARENTIHPVPYADDNSEGTKRQKELLSKVKLAVIKDIDSALLADKDKSAVIIRDYTPQFNIQKGIPRATLQDSIIDFESQLIPFMQTAIINSTGVQGVKANDSDEASNILEASNSVRKAALEGNPWIPILQKMDRSALTNSGSFMAENYLMAIQGIDNLRQSFYGIANKGLYTKSQHTNTEENQMDQQRTYPLLDGLKLRQHACDLINAIWNIGISVKINDEVTSPIIGEGMKGGSQNEPTSQEQSEDLS